MVEKLQFVARRPAGDPLAELCRAFGIARKTGYKIFDQKQECGVQGVTDGSRSLRLIASSSISHTLEPRHLQKTAKNELCRAVPLKYIPRSGRR